MKQLSAYKYQSNVQLRIINSIFVNKHKLEIQSSKKSEIDNVHRTFIDYAKSWFISISRYFDIDTETFEPSFNLSGFVIDIIQIK